MVLRDALPKLKGTLCKVGVSLGHYSEEDLQTLDDWITKEFPVRQIVIALKSEYPDFSFAENTFFMHLRGQCQCPVETRFKNSYHE